MKEITKNKTPKITAQDKPGGQGPVLTI